MEKLCGGAAGMAQGEGDARAYWRANTRVICLLLVVWFVSGVVLSLLLAPWLNRWLVGRLPLGFWWAQQGTLYVFVAVIFLYAWLIDRLDRRMGVRE